MNDGTSRDTEGQDGTSVRAARSGWPPGRDAGGGHLAREAASTANYIAIPDDTPMVPRPGIGGRLVDLDLKRRRRLARGLGLEPVPVCDGECWCFGAPLGGSA
jgi:hypothetical protein